MGVLIYETSSSVYKKTLIDKTAKLKIFKEEDTISKENMEANKNKTLILSSFDIQEILRHFGIDWTMRALVERLRIAL